MKKIALLAFVCAAGYAPAQIARLYTPGRSVEDQGISLTSWGSGTIAQTDEVALQGTTSIRVSTRNFFQGGIIGFAEPIDLSDEASSPNNLLLITFLSADSGTTLGGSSGGGGGGGTSVLGAGGAGGVGGEEQGRGATAQAQGSADLDELDIETLRVIVTTEDGLKSEAYVDVTSTIANEVGWRRIGVPLQAINGLMRTNKRVTSIAFSADDFATIYFGEIEVINDTTPITGKPNFYEANFALGDQVTLYGVGNGGSSQLVYLWDFDKSDGVGIDAQGQVVRRTFNKAGEYVITLTIADAYGLKEPYTTEIKVKVNPG